ncbi:Fatty acid amide hydrolase-like protein [Cladobotryum mycophilum]|uniref:Fatty acid amide hydrolase-like protein n=1 Tax=Cladobotryum mycophilum TaxID=491253 RepID=A0ABR0SKJ5_9HYPO
MAPPEKFANYPEPIEGPDTGYILREDHNPVLRGYPLVLAGETGPMLDLAQDHLTSKYASSHAKYYTISDYHEAYKSGRVTPLEVAATLLSLTMRSHKYKDAWADYHDADRLALVAARDSTDRWAAGKPLGILDGVPIGVKDDTDVKGFINHVGMKYNPSIPFFKAKEKSSWPVRKLQEAGAVVIGKNTMHEIGADTNGLNVAQGTPTNHHNKLYYPGGSSNGGGSSVSAGVVPIAIGTDAGGSIRIPANFGGIYGLKPSHHRTMIMNNSMCITGPIAANVADLTIAYRFMSICLVHPPEPSAKRYMGVYRDWFNKADPPVKDLCDRALDYFASKRGYEIVDIHIPYLSEAQVCHAGICMTEMAESARTRTPNPADWLSLVGPANKVLLSVGAQTPAADYIKYNALRTLVMRHLAFLFQKYPGLLIMTPTTPMIGWPRSPGDDAYGASDTNRTMRNMMYIFLANLTGTPSVNAPVGYVDPEQGEGKLPVSLLATGEWGSEEQLLAWAAETEEYLHQEYPEGRKRPDTWVDVLNLAQVGNEGKN